MEAFAGGTEVANSIVAHIQCPNDRDLECEIPALPVLEAEIDSISQKIWAKKSANSGWYSDWCSIPLSSHIKIFSIN